MKIPTSPMPIPRWVSLLYVALLLTCSLTRAGNHRASLTPPHIYAFEVAAETTIDLGTTTSLNWTVGDADTVTLSPGVGDVTGRDSVDITPTQTTTYVLTAKNTAGSVSKSKKITVIVPPVFQSLTALPESIDVGGTTKLSWSATGATYYSVVADNDVDPGTVFGTSVVVRPKTTTTYTVTAVNTAGTNTRSITIPVTEPKPVINSFAATPATIVAGTATKLSWSVNNAKSLSISPGIGAVTGTSITVSPLTNTTYTLTATNARGSVTKTVSVTVTPAVAPVISSFTAIPGSIASGQTSTLNWSVSGATSLSILANVGTSPGVVTGSSLTVSPVTTTTYTLLATNATGSVSKNVTVKVAGPTAPVISSFFSNPAFIQAGATSSLSWSVAGADSISIAADVGTSPGVVTGTSIAVTPTATTTYTLTASNTVGKATASVPVTIFSAGNGAIVHPRILVRQSSVPFLNARVAANDPAWIGLRNDCDAYVGMPIQFPDSEPTGDTINGGYEYNDYLKPSYELALGYLACKTADPVRAARYAAKERELLIKLSDPVHHGRPTTDSGYSIRSYVPALAIGYDWIFETLSDSDRAQIYTEINRWVASYESVGFGRDFPQGNYFAGYYCAKAYAALATEGENPNGPAMWNDWLNRVHYGMVQPYYSAWLTGGGAPDGWNYGQFETINMLNPIAAAFTAKGLDLIHDARPFAYPDGHARWITQFTWPDMDTVSDRGFVYNSDDPTATDAGWATQFNGLLHLANGDNAPIMQRYTLDLRGIQGDGGVDAWVEFLLHDNSAPATDYRTALSYSTPGDGQGAMRSSWAQDAVWGAFQAGPYTGYDGSSEEFFDEGALTIQRGSIQLLVNTWGAMMRDTPGTSDGDPVFDDVYNELFQDQADGVHAGRRIFNTYYAVRPDGYWGQVGNGPGDSNTSLSRFEEGGSYVVMRGTNLESQYFDNHPIGSWSRSVAFVRPNLFVVHDRTTLKNAGADNWMAWHVEATPSEQSGAAAGTHRFDVIDTRAGFGGNLFRGRVTTVLPTGHRVNNVNVFNRGKVYRLEVRTESIVAASSWLTVFDASASAATAGIASPLSSNAGNVLAGNIEGSLVSNGAGNNVAVLFSTTGATATGALSVALPIHDTYCLFTDLIPNTGYRVLASLGNGQITLQLAPGGTMQTTSIGTLPLNVSADGVLTKP